MKKLTRSPARPAFLPKSHSGRTSALAVLGWLSQIGALEFMTGRPRPRAPVQQASPIAVFGDEKPHFPKGRMLISVSMLVLGTQLVMTIADCVATVRYRARVPP